MLVSSYFVLNGLNWKKSANDKVTNEIKWQ